MNGQEQANPSPSGVGQPPLTVVQSVRLIKAMGREAFNRWYGAYQRGEAKETVEGLILVLDTVGEDALRHIRIESALSYSINQPIVSSASDRIGSQMAQPAPPSLVAAEGTPRNKEARAGNSQMVKLATPNRAVTVPTLLNVVPAAVATPLLDTIPISTPTPQPLPIELQPLTEMGAYSPSLMMEASLWTDAGDKRRWERAGTARVEAWLPRINSPTGAALQNEGQEPGVTNCEECGEAIATSYMDRRQHTVMRHMVFGNLSMMERQATLKIAILRCFPDATVANDLTCNRCGMEIKDVAGRCAKELQNSHIQQFHYNSVGEGVRITCPITGCMRIHPPIHHLRALSSHVTLSHGGVRKLPEADKHNYEKFFDRVKEATQKILPSYFPVNPKGFLTRKRKAPLDINDTNADVRKLVVGRRKRNYEQLRDRAKEATKEMPASHFTRKRKAGPSRPY